MSFDPEDGGFAVYVLTRQDSYDTYGEAIIKGAAASWEISHGAAGGMSLNFVWKGTYAASANAYVPNTDTFRWGVWGLHINVTSGTGSTSTKQVVGTLNNKVTSWKAGNFGTTGDSYVGGVRSAAEPLYIGAPGGTYKGMILDVLVYKKTHSLQERADVLAWLDAKYYLTCPVLNSTNAVNGDAVLKKDQCVGARYGDECLQSCNPGFYRSYGESAHQCSAGEWTHSPIVCEVQCPPLVAPMFAGGCSRALFAYSNNFPATLLDSHWISAPRIPRSERDRAWKVVGGVLNADTTAICASFKPAMLVLDEPAWTANIGFALRATLSADILITSGSAGLVFRYVDNNNYYRLLLKASGGGPVEQAIFSVKNGVATKIANMSFALQTGATYAVGVTFQGSAISVSWSGQSRMNVTNSDNTYGSVGFVADGVSTVLKFSMTTDCDAGNNCLGAFPGASCTHSCASGYQLTGTAARTCGWDGSSLAGAWSGTDVTCAINPPTINTTVIQRVVESASLMDDVGRPIEVYSDAAKAVMTFSIVSETPASTLSPAPINRFGINSCSGLLFVNYIDANQTIDFETRSTYTVRIKVVPNGQDASAAFGDITVALIDVNEPAIFAGKPGPLIRSVAENSAALTLVGAPVVAVEQDTPPAFRNNAYSLDIADAMGFFAIDTATGQLYVNKTGLNFESQAVYNLRVRVVDVDDQSLSDTINVRVLVTDVNEPPVVPATQYFELQESEADLGAVFNEPLIAKDDDAGTTLVYAITGGNLDGATTLFAFDATLTGNLKWLVSRSLWTAANPPYVLDGRLVRTAYYLTVTVSDGVNAAVPSAVTVYIMADVNATTGSVVQDYKVGTNATSDPPRTAGREKLVVTATNLFVRYVPTVTFSDIGIGGNVTRRYRATNCAVTSSTTVECLTPPGQGRDLLVELALTDGGFPVPVTPSKPLLISYIAPAVSDVWGGSLYKVNGQYWVGTMNTRGGDYIRLVGTNFGLDCSGITITYGLYDNHAAFTGTCLNATHNELWFLSGPGMIQYYLYIDVTVGNQLFVGSDYQLTIGYKKPNITNIYSYDYPAAPGDTILYMPSPPDYSWGPYPTWLYFEGENFGPDVVGGSESVPVLRYGPASTCLYYWDTTGCPFVSQYCYKSYGDTSHSLFYCQTDRSWGKNLTFIVSFEVNYYVTYSDPSINTRGPGGVGSVSHYPPFITQASGPGVRLADTAGGQSIVLDGTNLGTLKLIQETYPNDIEVRYGNRYQFPDTPAFWRQRYQYRATSCKVTKATVQASTLICASAEGTGVGHSLRISVGGQYSNVLTNIINYSPPIVASFDGPGATDADTRGYQPVIIYGKNFGNNLTLVSTSFKATLDLTARNSIPTGGYFYDVNPGRANISSTPINCTYATNHTQLLCYTNEFAGADIKWTVVVDGQTSRDPFTFYGVPRVLNITLWNPVTRQQVATADPNGGTIALLEGVNFGRKTPFYDLITFLAEPRQFMNWLSYKPGGVSQYLIPTLVLGSAPTMWSVTTNNRYVVLSHTLMAVRLGPGYGQGLSFTMSVLDQVSSTGGATFSYTSPLITRITPLNGTTLSTIDDPVRIVIYGLDFPGVADRQSVAELVFGNTPDNSKNANGVTTCVRNGVTNPVILEQAVTCVIPGYNGRRRGVVLRFNRPGVVGATTVLALPFVQPNLFDFFDPVVYYSASSTVGKFNNAEVLALATRVFPSDPNATRVVTLFGSDFGYQPGATVSTRDSILRQIYIRTPGDATWLVSALPTTLPNPASMTVTLQSQGWWRHTSLTFLTNMTDAEVKVVITSRDHEGYSTNPIIQESNVVDISSGQRNLTGIEPVDGFNTTGGAVLTIKSPYAAFSGGAALLMQIGRDGPTAANCPILNLNWDNSGVGSGAIPGQYVTDVQAVAFIAQTCQSKYGAAIRPESECRFHCEMPPHTGGAAVPVFMRKDGKLSDGSVTVAFLPPLIESVTVVEPGEADLLTARADVEAGSGVVVAPTNGSAVMVIRGYNFGLCGVVQLASKIDSCTAFGAVAGHSLMRIPIPAGQGSAFVDFITGNLTNFTLAVLAGGQRGVRPFPFRFRAPTILAIEPSTGPTRGGSVLTIRGRDFGEANAGESNLPPLIHLVNPDFPYAPQECVNVTRIDHQTVSCTTPEGSGGDMAVLLEAGNQQGASRVAGGTGPTFSFVRPAITSVEVETWDAGLYDNWPLAWNANRTLSAPTWANFTTPAGVARAPTAGRVRVRMFGSNFGPRTSASTSAGGNCVHLLFDLAARDCVGNFADAITPYCFCTMNPTLAASDVKCQWPYAAQILTESQNPAVSPLGYARPICNGREDYPGEGEVYDDGGADLSLSHRASLFEDITGATDLLGSGLVISWDHEKIEILLPPGAGAHVLTVDARGQFPFMYQDMRLRYDAPEVTEIVSLSGEIMTGPGANDIVEIRGRNFGAGQPIARVDKADLPTQDWLRTAEPIREDPMGLLLFQDLDDVLASRGLSTDSLAATPSRVEVYRALNGGGRALPIRDDDVTAAGHMTIAWWKFCLTDAVPFAQTEPAPGWYETATRRVFDPSHPANALLAPVAGCASRDWPFPGYNHTPYTILRRTHSSIIVRSSPGWGFDRAGAVRIHSHRYVHASGAFNFSYSDPVLARLSPNEPFLYLSMPDSPLLTISGYNFGNAADFTYYDLQTDKVFVLLDGQEFVWNPFPMVANSSLVPSRGAVTVRVDNVTVGRKDLALSVAGQVGQLSGLKTGSLYVVCSKGSFGRYGELCIPCPSIADCDGYQKTMETLMLMQPEKYNFSDPDVYNLPHPYPRPYPTFYNLNATDTLNPGERMDAVCPEKIRAQYPTRDVCLVGCLPAEACAGGNFCTSGYVSKAPFYACGSCDKGYYRRGMECARCPDSPWVLVIGFVLLAVSMVGVGYFLNKQNVNIAFLSIAVDYMQVISMFANSRIAWPKAIKDLLQILSAFNLNIEIIAPECIKPDLSYAQKWSGIMMLPITACTVFLGIFTAGYIWKRHILGQRGRAFLTGHRNALIAMFLILFYFLYLYITRSLLEVFNCVSRVPDDGYQYMAAVMEQCYKPGGTQLLLMPAAITGLLVYTAGYPAFAAYVLYRYRFAIMLDQLLRAKATGDTPMTNPQALHIRLRYSRLYYQYKPDLYWWMLLIILRKFFIAFTSLMFRNDGGFQMAVALLVLFAAYAVQVKKEPFMSPSDRAVVLREHDRLKFEGGIHASLAEGLKDTAAGGRKRTARVDWTAPKAILGKQILARAGLFMFNYNTVEATTLGCAILVCLAGIMFDSLANKRMNENPGLQAASRTCQPQYASYCDGLMTSVITLVSVSIIYLMVVVVVEIYGAIQEAQMAKANNVQRARMAKKLGVGSGGRGSGSGRGLKGALDRQLSKSLKDQDPDAIAAAEAQFVSRIGILDTAVNPLFASQKAAEDEKNGVGGLQGDGFLNASAIGDMVQPPNAALWSVVRDTYTTLLTQTQAQTAQINELKRKVQQFEANGESSSGGRGEEDDEASLPSPGGAASFLGRSRGAGRPYMGGPAAMPAAMTVEANPRAQLSGYRPQGRPGGARKAFAPQFSRDE